MEFAPYAMRDEDTEGRRYPEASHPYRSEFQRDRDRVMHSKAFRRLERKTQVFAPDYSDHFRNRLTHTLEVSQISRTIAEALGLNADLCEVLALSHDIGHPPFSHEGEQALDSLMQRYRAGFDHNLHALRIVEDFEEKYAAFRGLNLTFEVREGIIKHSRDYEKGEKTAIDLREYRPGQRPPLEGQLIDMGDEIAYNAADLDDGYDSGLLSLSLLRQELLIFRVLWKKVDDAYPLAEEKLKVSEVVRGIIDALVTSLIEGTRARLEGLNLANVEEVRDHPVRLCSFGEDEASMNAELKSFLRHSLYDHEVLKQAREDAQKQVHHLFDFYMENPASLPASHQSRLERHGLHRVVCDYVAGMTDSFARSKHAELCGCGAGDHQPVKRDAAGSILDTTGPLD